MAASLKIQPVREGEILPNRVQRILGFEEGCVIFPFLVQTHQSPKHAEIIIKVVEDLKKNLFIDEQHGFWSD